MNRHRKYFEAFLGGKERPFKFGINTAQLYCELKGIELHEFDDEFPAKDFIDGKFNMPRLRDLIYCCAKDGERYKIKQGDNYPVEEYSPLDVGDWMDDMGTDKASDLLDKLVKSIFSSIIEQVEKLQENGEKKR